jgi:hypothetical protein
MAHFALSLIFGLLMYWCHLFQPRFNRSFGVLAAIFFGSVGLATRGTIPQCLRNPSLDALGRAIVGNEPPPKRHRRHA